MPSLSYGVSGIATREAIAAAPTSTDRGVNNTNETYDFEPAHSPRQAHKMKENNMRMLGSVAAVCAMGCTYPAHVTVQNPTTMEVQATARLHEKDGTLIDQASAIIPAGSRSSVLTLDGASKGDQIRLFYLPKGAAVSQRGQTEVVPKKQPSSHLMTVGALRRFDPQETIDTFRDITNFLGSRVDTTKPQIKANRGRLTELARLPDNGLIISDGAPGDDTAIANSEVARHFVFDDAAPINLDRASERSWDTLIDNSVSAHTTVSLPFGSLQGSLAKRQLYRLTVDLEHIHYVSPSSDVLTRVFTMPAGQERRRKLEELRRFVALHTSSEKPGRQICDIKAISILKSGHLVLVKLNNIKSEADLAAGGIFSADGQFSSVDEKHESIRVGEMIVEIKHRCKKLSELADLVGRALDPDIDTSDVKLVGVRLRDGNKFGAIDVGKGVGTAYLAVPPARRVRVRFEARAETSIPGANNNRVNFFLRFQSVAGTKSVGYNNGGYGHDATGEMILENWQGGGIEFSVSLATCATDKGPNQCTGSWAVTAEVIAP